MATAQGDIMIGSVKNMVDRLSKDFSAQKPPLSIHEPRKPLFNKNPQVVVTFAYKPSQGDELHLVAGDIIEVLEEIEDGWSRGRNIKTGETGMFPTNFVEAKATPTTTNVPVLRPSSDGNHPPEPEATKRAPSVVGIPLPAMTSQPAVVAAAVKKESPPAGRKEEAPPQPRKEPEPAAAAAKTKEMARVKFVYEPQHPDELRLGEIGLLIEIVRKDCGDPGWFEGELNGKTGLFPDNFVELVQVPAGSTSGSPKTAAAKVAGEQQQPLRATNKAPILAPSGSQPPAVPAKPKPKLSESNGSLNRIDPLVTTATTTGTTTAPTLPSASAKPSSNFSDIRNRLVGLPMLAPGDPAPAGLSRSTYVNGSGDDTVPPPSAQRPVSTYEISSEALEQPSAQLSHATKDRPRGPGKRPTSMMVTKMKTSTDNLLDSPSTTAVPHIEPLEKSTELATTTTTTSTSSSRFPAMKPLIKEETTFPAIASSHSSSKEEMVKVRAFQPTTGPVTTKISPVPAAATAAGADDTPVSRKEYNDLLARVAVLETRIASMEATF